MNDTNKTKVVKKVTLLGAITNILLSFFKITIGKVTGSHALIADGVHSFSDLISDAVIYFGASRWSQPADEDHRYGHGRLETLINAFLAFSLLCVAIGLTYQVFTSPTASEPLEYGNSALVIVVIGVVVKEWLYRWTLAKSAEVNSQALRANAYHHRSDALSSLPVLIAIGVQSFYPKLVLIDAIATVIVSGMLLKASYDIAQPAFFELTEKHTFGDMERKIQFYALEEPEIKETHHIRFRRLGGDVVVDLHILVDEHMTVFTSHKTAERFKHTITKYSPEVKDVVIHVEPWNCCERVIYGCNCA